MSPSALLTSSLFFTLFILLLYVISLMLTTLTFTVSLKLDKTNHYLYWTSKLYTSKLLLTKRLKPWFDVKIRLFQRTWTWVHVRYMLSPIRLTVCRLSVRLVHLTQPVDISTIFPAPFGTLAILWHQWNLENFTDIVPGEAFRQGVQTQDG